MRCSFTVAYLFISEAQSKNFLHQSSDFTTYGGTRRFSSYGRLRCVCSLIKCCFYCFLNISLRLYIVVYCVTWDKFCNMFIFSTTQLAVWTLAAEWFSSCTARVVAATICVHMNPSSDENEIVDYNSELSSASKCKWTWTLPIQYQHRHQQQQKWIIKNRSIFAIRININKLCCRMYRSATGYRPQCIASQADRQSDRRQ